MPVQPGQAAVSTDLSVTISGLRNDKGNVLLCVTRNADQFPDCSKDEAATRLVVPVAKLRKTGQLSVPLAQPGTYAISLVHDENANGKLDKLLLVPREGYGFSRNPAIHFGPPSFQAASFTAGSSPTEQNIKVKYSL